MIITNSPKCELEQDELNKIIGFVGKTLDENICPNCIKTMDSTGKELNKLIQKAFDSGRNYEIVKMRERQQIGGLKGQGSNHEN